ncbi:hypothetical protein BGZ52_009391 [Haplosporangium bisporale]|nr:hypothetical protein BGZ52_009391 [Haplosporangium bisporale]
MVPSNFDVDMKAVDSLPSETTPVLKDKDKDVKVTTIAHGQEAETNDRGPLIHTDATTNQETNGHSTDQDIDMITTSRLQQKDEEPRISEEILLLDRLVSHEMGTDSASDTTSGFSSDSDVSESPETPLRSRRSSPVRSNLSKVAQKKGPPLAHHPKKAGNKTPTKKPLSKDVKEKRTDAPASTPSLITNVGSATQKPKRIHNSLKHRPGPPRVRKVLHVDRDEHGNVKLPVTIGILTILDIGHVVWDREAFHNERYIWPVGYRASRSYNSMIDPSHQTIYTCSIVDDGDAPKFQIDAEDQPGKPIIAGTATGAWTHVVKTANMIRRRDHSNSASGPDYFGFSNATIAKLIQDLPNAEKCKTYVMQLFEEPSATTGKSTPAGTAPTSPTTEKRKHSALGSNGQDQDDVEEEEDDDAYASLGTPGKKKRSSSPVIRHAGYEPRKSVDLGHGEEDGEGDMEGEEEEEEEEENIDELDEEGDDHATIDVETKEEEDSETIDIDDDAFSSVRDKNASLD